LIHYGRLSASSVPQRWGILLFCAQAILFAAASPVRAQQVVVTVDPAATQINFTLGATMHTVHGTFKLKSGQMRWDTATGHASGAIVIDATSANTDNSSRDKNMHAQVLESAKFPEIVFTPSQIKGTLAKDGPSQVEVSGLIKLHGQDHDTKLNLSVQPGPGGTLQVTTQFPVPFKMWGLKDPSTFLLHVADNVDVEIHAVARIAPAQ
jgi:polyisoprenoid-binding protein YceI